MNDLSTVFEQARLFANQHVPTQVWTMGIPLAIGTLLLGVGVSVLGAKLAKYGATLLFIVFGMALGHRFAALLNLPAILCVIIGAGMVGIIGYLTFRIWVGVLASVVIVGLALGVFGYNKVAPHLKDFEAQGVHGQVALASTEGVQFSLPTPDEQRALLERKPEQWSKDFWSFVTARDATIQRNASAVSLVALITGLLFGLIATRATLVLSTSLLGTLCVASGLATLLSAWTPGIYQTVVSRPDMAGIGIGGFLVTSLVLQAILMRRAKKEEPKTSPTS
ncbi:MAG: hypothetical protein AABZ47_15840 [Planctomycetota bacterium]